MKLHCIGSCFDYTICDENAQSEEYQALTAVLISSRAVLVGDPKQLGPTSQTELSYGFWYFFNLKCYCGHDYMIRTGICLMDNFFYRFGRGASETSQTLTHQFRMRKNILQFPNEKFYDGELKTTIELDEKLHIKYILFLLMISSLILYLFVKYWTEMVLFVTEDKWLWLNRSGVGVLCCRRTHHRTTAVQFSHKRTLVLFSHKPLVFNHKPDK